jgi:hypothetical protein
MGASGGPKKTIGLHETCNILSPQSILRYLRYVVTQTKAGRWLTKASFSGQQVEQFEKWHLSLSRMHCAMSWKETRPQTNLLQHPQETYSIFCDRLLSRLRNVKQRIMKYTTIGLQLRTSFVLTDSIFSFHHRWYSRTKA